MFSSVVVIGCGYTGSRVAVRLADRGISVIATSRHGQQIHFDTSEKPLNLSFVPEGARVLYSVPTLDTDDPTPDVFAALAQRRVARLVYLSTTGVYGAQLDVDEHSTPAPRRPADAARIAAERAALAGPWSAIVLRPAAIYGPGRGIHVSMAESRYRLGGDGTNFVSRIHVDDLAAHCDAALFSELTGAWPVADEDPCTAREIAEFCSNLLRVPMPPSVDRTSLHHTRQANRRVDGSAVRRELGITLRYPGYRTGIPASV